MDLQAKKNQIAELLTKLIIISPDKKQKIREKMDSFDDTKAEKVLAVLNKSMEKQHEMLKRNVATNSELVGKLKTLAHKDFMEILHEKEEIERQKELAILAEIDKEIEAL